MASRYIRVDRGSGSRAGQLLRHADDPTRWQVRIYLGRSGSTKRYRSEIVHGRKRDAEARLIELLNERNQGTLTTRTDPHKTLEQATSAWLAHKQHHVTARTLASYRNAVTAYALPALGQTRLSKLTRAHFSRLYDTMRAGTLPPEAKAAGWRGEPLSARTVQITHAALTQVLSFAVSNEWLTRSVLTEARGLAPTPKKRDKFAMNASQRAAFLAASDTLGAFYAVLYRVLMDTGMRPGEAAALTWRDLDLAGGYVTITKAVTQGERGQPVIAAPKTPRSRRTIPAFGLEEVLLRHREWQAERGLLDDSPTGRVFTTQAGTLLKPWTFSRRELGRVTEAAGIGQAVTLYTFRHTFATLHLASGTPLKVVSEWLGHSTIKQTADTYQHASTAVFTDYAARHLEWLKRAEEEREALMN